MQWWYYLIVAAIGYLLGSVNFAKIFAALKKKKIDEMGSGNPGTMNMLRSVGIRMGLLTLFADIFKAIAACLIAYFLTDKFGVYVTGLFVILGHNYSVFLKFKGGKGVACFIGTFAVANPIATVIAFVLLLIYLFTFKYGSIGSFLVVIGLSVTECILNRNSPEVIVVILLIMFLVLYSHRENMLRLIRGQENKLELIKYLKNAKERKRQKNQQNEP